MSLRTGVFIKYVVEFLTPTLKVSNDVLAGDICLDADIWVGMSRGTAGTSFEIKLYDLPENKARALAAATSGGDDPGADPQLLVTSGAQVKGKSKPHLRISLGYFDTRVETVLEGVYESVHAEAGDDRLVTTVKGREAALYACFQTPFAACLSDDSTFADAIRKIMSAAKFPDGTIDRTAQIDAALAKGKLRNLRFNANNVLGALDEIAERAEAELLLVDRKVVVGSPISYGDATIELDRDANLAKFQPLRKAIAEEDENDPANPVKATDMEGFKFTIVGDGTIRPGHKVVVKNVKNYDSNANPEFRLRQVEHQYSSTSGYSCLGFATRRLKDGAQARRIDSIADRSARAAARSVGDKIKAQAFENPAVEVASIKRAADGYRADLYYGQPASGSETRPSVNMPVSALPDQVHEETPISSIFAWYRCGLVTPAYPGMKALVLHNRALASDGIVSGYLWSKDPAYEPPPNKLGDWWLSLPIDLGADQAPTSWTTAVNDLTDAAGLRVMELKGLKIMVGSKGLSSVGARPQPGDADVCTIAHASGSVVTIKDGEIAVDTGKGPKLTLSASGITLTDGTLNVRLAGGQLAIG